MFFYVSQLNFVLALASLLLVALAALFFIDYYVLKEKYTSSINKNWWWVAIVTITAGSVGMSLVYSEYFGFVPCSLCWLQRIALYPQALLALVAFRRNDIIHFPVYGIALSIFGFFVAVYHYVYQALPKESLMNGMLPCLVDGSNADCAVKIMNVFGFITFPFLSAVTFAFLITMYLHLLKNK